MKIRIERKNGNKFLVIFFDDEKEVKGVYLNDSELSKLKANIDEIIEYKTKSSGDSL